jgi:hypothetical protein
MGLQTPPRPLRGAAARLHWTGYVCTAFAGVCTVRNIDGIWRSRGAPAFAERLHAFPCKHAARLQ